MKIQNNYKMISGLLLLIAIIGVVVFQSRRKNTPIIYEDPGAAEAQNRVNSMTSYEESDIYCGILLMPKSMLPTLKQFSNYDIAKNIKILPANIEWEDGQMLVIPKEAILKEINDKMDGIKNEDGNANHIAPEEYAAAKINKLNPALLYFFLANASKNKIIY